MQARRALFYLPGDDRHKIKKATRLDVDCNRPRIKAAESVLERAYDW